MYFVRQQDNVSYRQFHSVYPLDVPRCCLGFHFQQLETGLKRKKDKTYLDVTAEYILQFFLEDMQKIALD